MTLSKKYGATKTTNVKGLTDLELTYLLEGSCNHGSTIPEDDIAEIRAELESRRQPVVAVVEVPVEVPVEAPVVDVKKKKGQG